MIKVLLSGVVAAGLVLLVGGCSNDVQNKPVTSIEKKELPPKPAITGPKGEKGSGSAVSE